MWPCIGVLRPVYGTPVFGLVYRTPLFRTDVKNFLSTAINRGDLRRSNYTKTVFGLRYMGAHDAHPHLDHSAAATSRRAECF